MTGSKQISARTRPPDQGLGDTVPAPRSPLPGENSGEHEPPRGDEKRLLVAEPQS